MKVSGKIDSRFTDLVEPCTKFGGPFYQVVIRLSEADSMEILPLLEDAIYEASELGNVTGKPKKNPFSHNPDGSITIRFRAPVRKWVPKGEPKPEPFTLPLEGFMSAPVLGDEILIDFDIRPYNAAFGYGITLEMSHISKL